MLTTLGGINESMIQIVGFFVLGMIIIEGIIILASCEWLFLSFKCAVCKLDYSKALFFVLSLSYFQCPFCHRSSPISPDSSYNCLRLVRILPDNLAP